MKLFTIPESKKQECKPHRMKESKNKEINKVSCKDCNKEKQVIKELRRKKCN